MNVEYFQIGINFMSLIVSGFLAFFMYKISNTHNHIVVRPYGKINTWKKGGEFQIKLTNYGTGPLFTKELNIFYEDRKYNNFLRNFAKEELEIADEDILKFRLDPEQIIVGPKEETYLLVVETSSYKRDKLSEKFAKLRIELKYEDMYGEKFVCLYEDMGFEKLFPSN